MPKGDTSNQTCIASFFRVVRHPFLDNVFGNQVRVRSESDPQNQISARSGREVRL